MYDIKIVNGKVVDFDINGFKLCDVGIKNGKITAIGNLCESSKVEINGEGKIVSPGFIDIHMHEEVIGESADNDAYDIANKMMLMGVTTCVGGNCGNNRQSLKNFFSYIDNNGSPVNYLMLLGHNYLRNQVGIDDPYRKSTQLEINKMQKLVSENMSLGAIGISFGLEYSPGIDFDEAIQVCKGTDENILLSAHYRSDGEKSLASIEELIAISKTTKFPMQISHIGSCSAMGTMQESLDIIQNAIMNGIEVSADCYPYEAFSTFIGSAVFDEGCFERWNKSYDSILLTEAPYTGLRCDKDLFYKIRKEYPNMIVVAFVMNEYEVIQAIKAPFVIVASDGLYRKGQGHPRGAGTFPRVLGRYAREIQAISLMNALKKMTLLPAQVLGLNHKGQLKEGMDADVVIFDPEKIMDMATFENPTAPPKGINYVLLNGKIAVKSSIIVNNRLGKAIRKKELSKWGM